MAEGTVSAQLRHWSLNDPDKAAFIFRRERPSSWRLVLTRRETFTLAARYAAILRRRGIEHGDVVCNTLPNSPERVISDLGIMLAGAVAMNGMVFLADGSGLVTSLRKSSSVALVLDPALPNNALTVLQDKLESRTELGARCPQAPRFRHLLLVDCGSGVQDSGHKPFLEELRQAEDQFVAQTKPSDLAYINTTSGSSGFSKLVPRTHAYILQQGEIIFTHFGFELHNIYFNDLALGWIGGFPGVYIQRGVTRVLTDGAMPIADPLGMAWEVMRGEGCTICLLLPLQLDKSLSKPELWQGMNPRLRVMMTGHPQSRGDSPEEASALSEDNPYANTMQRYKMTDSLSVLYGMTETGFNTVRRLFSDNIDTYQDGDSGLPVRDLQLKLVTEDGMKVVKAGDVGEVLVKGPAVFTGYLDADQTPTSSHIFTDDGWFSTGDTGFKDSQGHLYVTCRKSNAIMHGTVILYPGWLETKIETCPGIQNVIIVPVPDPVIYQELCACVVLKPGVKMTEEDVREFCRTLFAVPDIAFVPRFYVLFDSFPTTSTGKVDRKVIRKAALKQLGIADSAIVAVPEEASRT